MSNTNRIVSLLLFCVISLSPFFQAKAQIPRLSFGRPRLATVQKTHRPEPLQHFDEASLTRKTLLEKLTSVCEEAKNSVTKPKETDLLVCRTKLRATVDSLRLTLSRPANRQQAEMCGEKLQLSVLSNSLRSRRPSASEPITEAFQVLEQSRFEWDQEIFGPLRNRLRQYLTLEIAVNNGEFSSQFADLCEALPNFVSLYLEGINPEYGPPLAEATLWLSDLGVCVPAGKRIADSLGTMLGHPNFYFSASSRFLCVGFERDLEEDLEVKEDILGTAVFGTGHLSGQTSAVLRSNNKRAEIRTLLNGEMRTETVGYNGPVRIFNDNFGPVSSEKSVFFDSERFYTSGARSRASLASKTKRLQINGGPLVQCIAPKIVQQKKPASEAEARRRAAQRLGSRFNETLDARIDELNGRYQDAFREPLLQAGFFPRIFDLRTTDDRLSGTFLIADSSQPSAASRPPEIPQGADLQVQLHQSMPTNAASFGLAGRRIEEEKWFAALQEKFPNLAEKLERNLEQSPLTVTFAKKLPIAFVFDDQTMSVIVHTDRFEQEGREYPGLDITLKYRIRTETVESNGGTKPRIVLELAEPASVFPSGFDPKSGARIAGREQMIRSIVMKRLERSLSKTLTLEPIDLSGEWEERGTLEPVFGSSENGWLSLAWKWNGRTN